MKDTAPDPQGYIGNKKAYGSFQNIINQFGPHVNFISGFGGAGVIEFAKKRAHRNIVFELSGKTIKKYWSWKHGYTVNHEDFLTWCRSHPNYTEATLVYCDPPYLLSSRANGREYYEHEMTRAQHIEFLHLVKQLPYSVAISHYKCPLYDKMLRDWRFIEWKVNTHTGIRYEGLYMNYARPTQLHQYNYLGKNRTERQQIKRKKERLLQRLKKKNIENCYLELYAMVEALDQLRD